MNLVIHALTALFMYLAIRESSRGTDVRLRDAPLVIILVLVAFVLAYAQNIPLPAIQSFVASSWYPFDVTEKLVSLFFFCLALAASRRLKANARDSVEIAKLTSK